jgi:ATP-dependent RNA helicase DeaD
MELFMSSDEFSPTTFEDLDLSKQVMKALDAVGYESPSPIQAQTIPHLLSGVDVLGQAQTGTGKTAAFALPFLSKIDIKKMQPQALVLTPTRELAIQVAEAFKRYASKLTNFHVLPIYGGQDYGGQIRRLQRGVHVIVGTPGRLMDHMRRGTLKLDSINYMVLDEADEMLRMGFQEDVEWILEQTPETRQTALFSATMPKEIRRIAQKYLTEPVEVMIKDRTATVESTRQRYWMVSGFHKLDALTRILEAEPWEAIIIFVRTKNATVELSERLEARGYASAPINGDMPQNKREKTIEQLKTGKLNILIATDVAARGLDVDRISHVINYDTPYDAESYVHRIGRTGRMGRSGEAILFVAPRERKMLAAIERTTRQKIQLMEMPSTETINDVRISRFKQRITETIETGDLTFYNQLIEKYQEELNLPVLEIAAALAKLVQGDEPFLLTRSAEKRKATTEERTRIKKNTPKGKSTNFSVEEGLARYRIEVGHNHNVEPRNIVGAIANEAGLESRYIGRINIFDEYSTVDLPEGMPKDILKLLKKVWVAGQALKISKMDDAAKADDSGKRKAYKPKQSSDRPPRRKKDDKSRGAKGGKGKSKSSKY